MGWSENNALGAGFDGTSTDGALEYSGKQSCQLCKKLHNDCGNAILLRVCFLCGIKRQIIKDLFLCRWAAPS